MKKKEMRGFKVNPDADYVSVIIEGLIKKEGHCPCQTGKTEGNLCPCTTFRNERHCCCNLYVDDDSFNSILKRLKGGEKTDGNEK